MWAGEMWYTSHLDPLLKALLRGLIAPDVKVWRTSQIKMSDLV
jgi:hypothetical protein